MSEQKAIIIQPEDGQRQWMAQFDGAQSIGQLAAKLRRVVKGGDKLNDNELLGLAQTAVLHDLDPTGQSPEVWGIPGRGVYVGIEGWRKCANRNLDEGDMWWVHYERLTPEEREQEHIQDGDDAIWALLEFASRIRLRASLLKDLQESGMDFDTAWQVVDYSGLGPTRGLGVLRKSEIKTELSKSAGAWEPSQKVRVRAERDAIKQAFGIDLDGTYLPADTVIEFDRPQITEGERKEKAMRASRLLGGSDEDDYLSAAPAPQQDDVVMGEFSVDDGEAQEERPFHWIDEARGAFWGWARGTMGLTDAQVYEALGVEHIHDFAGDKKEAMECIKAYADKLHTYDPEGAERERSELEEYFTGLDTLIVAMQKNSILCPEGKEREALRVLNMARQEGVEFDRKSVSAAIETLVAMVTREADKEAAKQGEMFS